MESLSPAVFEILRSKRIVVTILTFQSHVTSSIYHFGFLLVVLWNQASISLTISEIFNVKCNAMVAVTLIRPANKGQGHSFWYQSISHIRLPIGCRGTAAAAAAAPPPFRPGNPALCGSRPLFTPYYCRLRDLLCFVFISTYCMFDLSVYYLFLQYFDTVGWVF